MKFYLSSYKLGNKVQELKNFIGTDFIYYIPNAIDNIDETTKINVIKKDLDLFNSEKIKYEILDLRKFFNDHKTLENKILKNPKIFIRGGNVFILIRAIRLSGLDNILKEHIHNDNFLYSGYSAAGCVLSKTLSCYQIVDKPELNPYNESTEIILDGLGLIDFAFMPHWNSDHPESLYINKEIEYCIKNKIKYHALKDGEVLIINR